MKSCTGVFWWRHSCWNRTKILCIWGDHGNLCVAPDKFHQGCEHAICKSRSCKVLKIEDLSCHDTRSGSHILR